MPDQPDRPLPSTDFVVTGHTDPDGTTALMVYVGVGGFQPTAHYTDPDPVLLDPGAFCVQPPVRFSHVEMRGTARAYGMAIGSDMAEAWERLGHLVAGWPMGSPARPPESLLRLVRP